MTLLNLNSVTNNNMKIVIYNTKRKSWMFKPTTRIKHSSKLYNRKRHKQVLTPVEVDECYSDM